MRLKRCFYGREFSAKSWYVTLNLFLTEELGFLRARVEGCLYILYRKDEEWIKMINYVDAALYYTNNNKVRGMFEKKPSK